MYCRKKINYQVGSIQNLSRNREVYNFLISYFPQTLERGRSFLFIRNFSKGCNFCWVLGWSMPASLHFLVSNLILK